MKSVKSGAKVSVVLLGASLLSLALLFSFAGCSEEETQESLDTSQESSIADTSTGDSQVTSDTMPNANAETKVNTEVVTMNTMTVEQLANADERLDGAFVCVTGEVTGDLINSTGGNYWICIEDVESNSAISVLISSEQAALIENFGNYSTKGDTVTINGYFHISCATDGGIADVHASSVRVSEEGFEVNRTISIGSFIIPIALLAAGAFLFIRYRSLRKRED